MFMQKRENYGVDISEQELLEKYPEALRALLKDHSRTRHEMGKMKKEGLKVDKAFQCNIIWGTNNYSGEGEAYGEEKEITEALITGERRFLVMPRALKNADIQRQRSRDMAEVFTPAWVCNAQNNLVDDAWFGRTGAFNRETVVDGEHRWEPAKGKIEFPEKPSPKSTKSWKDYVRDVRLEITCGEAPYLASRYDVVEGKLIPIENRIGLLDRKLRVVSENTKTSKEWLDWAREAVRAIYGFEWQGDNLLLAREALLFTVKDYYEAKAKSEGWRQKFSSVSMKSFAYIISWNLWQMDGLKKVIPYSCHAEEDVQQDLFAPSVKRMCPACEKGLLTGHNGIPCLVRDWQRYDKWLSRKKKSKVEVPDDSAVPFESLLKAN